MVTSSTAASRPGRPKSDEKRRDILRAAGDLFTRQGYRETSMDAIAAKAGVSKQTVYSHFQNKEELLRACVHGKIEEYELDMSAVSTAQPLDKALRRIGTAFITLLGDPSVVAMYRLLISESVAHPHLAQAFYDAGPITTMKGLAKYLDGHPEFAAHQFANSFDAAELFFCLLKGSYYPMMLLNLRPPMDEVECSVYVERAVQRFLRLNA